MTREASRRRRRVRLLVLFLVVSAVAGSTFLWLAFRDARRAERIAGLQKARDELRVRLLALSAKDPVVSSAPDAEVLLGVPEGVATEMLGRIATRLVQKVEVVLRNLDVHKAGELRTKSFVKTPGRYRIDLRIHEVTGVLEPGAPKPDFRGDRVGIALPRRGPGDAALRVGLPRDRGPRLRRLPGADPGERVRRPPHVPGERDLRARARGRDPRRHPVLPGPQGEPPGGAVRRDLEGGRPRPLRALPAVPRGAEAGGRARPPATPPGAGVQREGPAQGLQAAPAPGHFPARGRGQRAHAPRAMVGRGASFADYDGDGDLDIAVVVHGGALRLARNDGGNARGWLRVVLRSAGRGGVPPRSTTFATGARVLLTAGGATQLREVGGQSSYLSHEPPGEVFFGTGDAATVERLEVRWPSGRGQTFTGLPTRATVEIVEGGEPRVAAAGR